MRQRRKSEATRVRTELWRRGSTSSSSGVCSMEGGGEQHERAGLSSGQRKRARKRHRQRRAAEAATAAAKGEEQEPAPADGPVSAGA